MNINIVNRSANALPAYQTTGSAGMDIRANLPAAPLSIQPLERVLVPTGLYVELPLGYEGQIRPRSGLALQKGLTVANAPGTIDSDFRGEIKIILINLSGVVQTVVHGERIAQMVVSKYEQIHWNAVESLSQSERGAGGFGSTGAV